MKPIKMLGLAALAALMTMAFVGVSSAVAETTALCQKDETPCEKASLVTNVHETTLAGSPMILLMSIGNVTCDVLFSGTAGALSSPQVVTGTFIASICQRGSETCTVIEKNGPDILTILREGHETGKVTDTFEIQIKCGSFINCAYESLGVIGTAKGPLLSSETNGSVSFSEQEFRKVAGFLCPTSLKLDMTTSPLKSTYISN